MAEKKHSRWSRFLLLWAGALLLLGLIGCVVLYRYLEVYEISRPELVMDELMSSFTAEDWLNAAAEELDFQTTRFEDAQDIYRRWRETLDLSGALSYRSEKRLTDQDKAVFVVRCGAANLCTVELVPEKALAFGQHSWTLGGIRSVDLSTTLHSAEVEITALPGQTILLNGLALGEGELTETGLEIPGLSSLEQRRASPPTMVKYRVSPLFGEIAVTDEDGRALIPANAGALVLYDALPADRVTLTVSAPADVTVTAGGVTLADEDLRDRSLGLLAGLETYTAGNEYETCTYVCEGLLTLPELRATDAAGHELTPLSAQDGHYVFLHAGQEETAASRQPVAEAFFRCYTGYLSDSFRVGRYAALLNLTLPGTELYAYFTQSVDTMYWAIQTDTEYRDLRYENFYPLGENAFVCTISYDAGVSGSTWVDSYSHEEQNTYELVFVQRDDVWLAAAMTVISG